MDIEKSFNDSCKEMETGKEYSMPQWASFLAMLSTVITKPAGYLIVLTAFSMLLYIEGGITLKAILCGIFLSSLSLSVMIFQSAARMKSQGVLESYMAYIYANYKIPVWLRKNFSKVN